MTTQAKDDPLEYVHNEIGYNYRLTNVLAAIGVAQMENLDAYVAAKRRIAELLHGAVGGRAGNPAHEGGALGLEHVLDVHGAGGSPDVRHGEPRLAAQLAEARIQARPLWQPIHASPAYAALPPAACPVADRLYQDALSLPCSVGLSDSQWEQVVQVVSR